MRNYQNGELRKIFYRIWRLSNISHETYTEKKCLKLCVINLVEKIQIFPSSEKMILPQNKR